MRGSSALDRITACSETKSVHYIVYYSIYAAEGNATGGNKVQVIDRAVIVQCSTIIVQFHVALYWFQRGAHMHQLASEVT